MSRVVGCLLLAKECQQFISGVIAHRWPFSRGRPNGWGIVSIIGITQLKFMEVGLDEVISTDLMQVC